MGTREKLLIGLTKRLPNLAPIHLLQSRDGPLDRWRGGLWGMSHSVAHTPLETLFLFQELARTGITTDGFDRAAKALVENELIKTDTSYDAARLTPDALRQLFLNVWTEELATANGTTTSPNSKRRKLNRPPVPTLKEAKQQVAEYPALVERLYARWRDSAVKSIREQEERLIVLAGEITSLDAEERAEKAKAAAPPRPPAPNGTPGPKTTPTPVPVPSTLPNPVQAAAAQPQVKPPAPAPHVEAPRQIRPAPAQATAPTQTPVPVPTPRPLAASPTPPSGPPAPTAGAATRWPQSQPPPYAQQQFSPTPAPVQPPKAAENQKRVTSPFVKQQPHTAIPAHLAPQLATPTPQRSASTPIPPPQTPVTAPPNSLITGSGTKWTNKATPSTPRPSGREIQSPAYEPLSPPQQPAPLPTSTPSQPSKKSSPKPVTKPETKTPRGRGRPPRSANKIRAGSTPSSVVGVPRRSQSVASQTDELSMDHVDLASRVKDENATPRVTPRATPKPHDETGDTTADESVPSRRNLITPSGVASRLAHKRKRQDTPTDLPAAPPTTVSWTRQFGRVSAAALDQISAHRFANQFANPIRERDAPGYKGLILQPQDIKSIRAAITHGNRTATEAAKGLPDGDPGTGTVILPIGDDLVPPKSIINSAQLERELFHMFSNAVMYNLNPSRGPGPSFVRMETSEGADALGYEVDEDAVVRSTRSMAGEVEKIIGELRNAEKGRSGQDPSTSGNTRPASVATGEDTPMAEDNDADELAGEADITSTTRRRRVGTRN
ncbi:Bromodomain-containing protein 1 [Colletotrichum fructicola]|nr:Bromodomain-containing protein 1 [Colletotrichum fructicola]